MNIQAAIDKYIQSNGFREFSPKAVLFDMDGVLINSMPNHSRSWHRAMERHGLKMSEAEAFKYEGMRSVEIVKLKAREQWHRELSDEEALKIYDTKIEEFAKCPKPEKIDGIDELLQMLYDERKIITVVTGSAQKGLLHRLETDFTPFIEKSRIVSSYDVTKGKPEPDPYLVGLKKSGNLQPWEAVVVENAPLGVQAGHAAKIFTIAVNTGPLDDEELWQSGADLVFSNMRELKDHWQQLTQGLNPQN